MHIHTHTYYPVVLNLLSPRLNLSLTYSLTHTSISVFAECLLKSCSSLSVFLSLARALSHTQLFSENIHTRVSRIQKQTHTKESQ